MATLESIKASLAALAKKIAAVTTATKTLVAAKTPASVTTAPKTTTAAPAPAAKAPAAKAPATTGVDWTAYYKGVLANPTASETSKAEARRQLGIVAPAPAPAPAATPAAAPTAKAPVKPLSAILNTTSKYIQDPNNPSASIPNPNYGKTTTSAAQPLSTILEPQPGSLAGLLKQKTPVSTYTGPSVVDYLKSIGQASDRPSRDKLAQQYGITGYVGSGPQNDRLLAALRGEVTAKTTKEEKPIIEPAKPKAEQITEVKQKIQETQAKIADLQAQKDKIDEEENKKQQDELDLIEKEAGADVDLSTSTKLIEKLTTALETEPTTQKTQQELFAEKRLELGVGGLETDLADVDKRLDQLEADFASTIEGEEARRVSMGQIRRRQTAQEIEYNRQKRDLQVERNSVVNQLNMKYGVLNTMMTLSGQDYENAQQNYQFKFNAALQLTNLLKGIEDSAKTDAERKTDNARANLQIMYNLIQGGNVSYDNLDEATKLDIKNAELQAGLPTGLTKFIQEKIKEPVVSFLPQFTDESGNQVLPVATIDAKGQYSIKNIKLGVKGEKATDLISQATLNKLAAAGVPSDIALDIQRSLNAGVSRDIIVAHLDRQLGEGKGEEIMKNYESIMSDITFQF